MAKQYEVGIPRCIANLEDLISFCVGYGIAYNPTNAALLITALNILLTNAKNSNLAVITALSNLKLAAKNRKVAFRNLKRLCTRIINALESSGASQEIVDNARTIVRKIMGKRTGRLLTIDPANPNPEHKNISVSQQSYVSLVDNFTKLIELLKIEPLYNPNETPLKIVNLESYRDNLTALNTAVVNAFTPYSIALTSRNNILYHHITGLVSTALLVKKYVKSVFGASSSQYLEIRGIKFTRPRRKR